MILCFINILNINNSNTIIQLNFQKILIKIIKIKLNLDILYKFRSILFFNSLNFFFYIYYFVNKIYFKKFLLFIKIIFL